LKGDRSGDFSGYEKYEKFNAKEEENSLVVSGLPSGYRMFSVLKNNNKTLENTLKKPNETEFIIYDKVHKKEALLRIKKYLKK